MILVAALAGFGAAALAGLAIAKTFTLKVGHNDKVTSAVSHVSKRENVVTDSRGFVVYTLSGETTHHAKCTQASGCLQFWFPVTVSSAKKMSKASGIKGKLGIWKRNGFKQVTLGGHPLYTFKLDTKKNAATGEDIVSFHGTWHVVKGDAKKSAGPVMTTTTGGSTTSTTTTSPYPYSY